MTEATRVSDERAIGIAFAIAMGSKSVVDGAADIIQYGTDAALQYATEPELFQDGILHAASVPKPDTLREALVAARKEVVLTIAFLGRDAGSARLNLTITSLISRLHNADAEILASLREHSDPANRLRAAAHELAHEANAAPVSAGQAEEIAKRST